MMKLTAKFAREAILSRNGLNHLRVELVPPTAPVVQGGKPVLMIFVIDRSGSMEEPAWRSAEESAYQRRGAYEHATKMSYAASAAIKFLGLLRPTDLFGVVSFDHIASIEQPLTPVNPANHRSVAERIQQIHPRGSTNISDAIEMARKMIAPELTEQYNCKIVLLSDGQANQGIANVDGLASIALRCQQSGITVSTLGIGIDYNANIMAQIARSGGGLFYHIVNMGELDGIFAQELQLAQAITAKGVRLTLSIPDLIEVGENLNGFIQSVQGGHIELLIGDLGWPSQVIFPIENHFVDADVSFSITVSYLSADGSSSQGSVEIGLRVVASKEELAKAPRDEEIIRAVLGLTKDRGVIRSAEAYERGDMAQARDMVMSMPEVVSSLGKAYAYEGPVDDLEIKEMIPTFLRRDDSARSSVKEMYARSSRAARGQKESGDKR